MRKPRLMTIGYIGASLDAFVSTLLDNHVECLIDTREIPLSRKKGFSKTALREELDRVGIAYRHYRMLGSPRQHRYELRETSDYDRFFTKIRLHLETSEAKGALEEASSVASSMASCLMCCCPEWHHCHRKCLAEVFTNDFGFEVMHFNPLRSASS